MLSTILGPTIPAQMANVPAMSASTAPSTWAISLELVLLQAQMKNFRMIRCEVIFSCVLHHDQMLQEHQWQHREQATKCCSLFLVPAIQIQDPTISGWVFGLRFGASLFKSEIANDRRK